MQYRIYAIFALIIFFQACSSNRLDVDVSGVDVNIDYDRFEEKMFAVKSVDEMKQLNKDLLESGGELYEFYVYEMLRSGSVYDDSIGNYLYYFVSDSIMKMTYQDMKAKFGDFSIEKEGINDMFKHLKFHLPKAAIPEKVITYNSAFNYGVISTDSKMGLGLEMYLGPYNRVVKELGFPLYIKEKMTADYLLVDIAHSWLITNVMENKKGDTFLSEMIHYGKLRYLIDAMMPDVEDHLKIRYTKEEYEWSLASEYNIWQFLMDMNWVYSTEMKVKMRFFEEAPTTVGLEGSPGRIGQFMGWQMVRQYMDKNKEVTVEQLLNEKNESKFLKTYKPKDE
ncbi:MAG: hypothetical protein WDZ35_07570 [Crocinitomicaceae bacterium]